MGITKVENSISDFKKNEVFSVVTGMWDCINAQTCRTQKKKGTSWWLLSLLNSQTCVFIRGKWIEIDSGIVPVIGKGNEGWLQKTRNVLVTGLRTADTPGSLFLGLGELSTRNRISSTCMHFVLSLSTDIRN